jgi:gas vesicle protein
MSQYLSFELVNKENPDIKVNLNFWEGSIAKRICWEFDGIFRYTNVDVKLDDDTLKSYIDTLHRGIERYKKRLLKQKDRKKENIELLIRAQSQVVVDVIKNSIKNNEDAIEDLEGEIETWTNVENKLNFIRYTLNENIENWELTYHNS